eukprot:1161724-Pelagomonas_calceolata.AAC.7
MNPAAEGLLHFTYSHRLKKAAARDLQESTPTPQGGADALEIARFGNRKPPLDDECCAKSHSMPWPKAHTQKPPGTPTSTFQYTPPTDVANASCAQKQAPPEVLAGLVTRD